MLYFAFEHPTWKDFFQALRSSFQLPSSATIGGKLMRAEYAVTMNDVMFALSKHSLICFTLDSATNLQGKQVINMMACGPKPFFLEHFTMELRKENVANLLEKLLNCKLHLLGSVANLLEKLLNCKLHLLGSIHQLAPSFVLSRDVIMFDDNDVEMVEQQEEGQVCTKNEHFINPSMFCFYSDSPSVMVKLHKECLKTKEFVFAYSCAPHAIHNLCMDLIKNFLGVKHILKQIVFMVKTLKSSHLLLQLFDKLCLEKFKKTYVLILFTKT
jgi:hypothetical protein